MNDLIRMTWRDYQRRQCIYRGEKVKLRPQEREILSTLLIQRGRPVETVTLIEELWPDPWREPELPHNSISVIIWRLRQILPGLINLWGGRRCGIGYVIELPTA